MRSKILTSSYNYGGARYTPKLFTEKGLYMLATILKGEKAIKASIAIIETYAKSSLELNFFIGKLKHTVKRKRIEGKDDIVE